MSDFKSENKEREAYLRLLGRLNQADREPPDIGAVLEGAEGRDPRRLEELMTGAARPRTVLFTLPRTLAGLAASLLLGVGLFYFRYSRTAPSDSSARNNFPVRAAVATEVNGAVRLLREKRILTLRRGDLLVPGDTLRVAAGEGVALSLNARAGIRLSENSELTIQELPRAREPSPAGKTAPPGPAGIRLLLKQGRLNGALVPGKGAPPAPDAANRRPVLEIRTPLLTVRVIGTVFSLETQPGRAVLRVAQGRVRAALRIGDRSVHMIQAPREFVVTSDGTREFRELGAADAKKMPRAVAFIGKKGKSGSSPVVKKEKRLSSEVELSKRYGRNPDLIVLKDGRRYRGIVVSQEGDSILVRTVEGFHRLSRDEIDRIRFIRSEDLRKTGER